MQKGGTQVSLIHSVLKYSWAYIESFLIRIPFYFCLGMTLHDSCLCPLSLSLPILNHSSVKGGLYLQLNNFLNLFAVCGISGVQMPPFISYYFHPF